MNKKSQILLHLVFIFANLAGIVTAAPPKKKPAKPNNVQLTIDEPTLKRVLKGTWRIRPGQSTYDATDQVWSFDGNLNMTLYGFFVNKSMLTAPGTPKPIRLVLDANTGLDNPANGPVLEIHEQRWLLLGLKEKELKYKILQGKETKGEHVLNKTGDKVYGEEPIKP